MGWVWEDDAGEANTAGDVTGFQNPNLRSEDRCSTRRIVKSQCRTEEVKPGKFVRKCQKTQQILKDCVGRPTEVVQSNEEYTEDDVTDLVVKGSSPLGLPEQGHFDFPGLRSDIEVIERNLFGGLNRFFEAAEEMKNGFFSVFGAPPVFDGESSSSSSTRRGISFEGSNPTKEASAEPFKAESGYGDLSGLAREV